MMQVVNFVVGIAVFAAAYATSYRVFNKNWPAAVTLVQVVTAYAVGVMTGAWNGGA